MGRRNVQEEAMRQELMQEQLGRIGRITGKVLTVYHSGSGRYWLAAARPDNPADYQQLTCSMSDEELAAYVEGMHAVVCDEKLGELVFTGKEKA